MSAEQRLIDESPQLLTLYRLLESVLPTEGERTEVMRRHLWVQGVRPAMWRLLHRVGTDWMTEVRPFYLRGRQRHAQIAIDILRVAQAFGTHSLVPLWLLKAFLSLYGNPNRPKSRYHPMLDDLYSLAGRLGMWAQSTTLGPLLQEHVHALLNWADREWCVHDAYNQSRVTLGSLLRMVRKQEEHDQLARQAESLWKIPQGLQLDCQLPGHRAVLIDSALRLWEEGRAMRHCADRFRQECFKGAYIVVSIRPIDGGRPLATVGIRRDVFGAKFDQVTGFANGPVTPTVRREAVRLAAQLGRQLRNRGTDQVAYPGAVSASRSLNPSSPHSTLDVGRPPDRSACG